VVLRAPVEGERGGEDRPTLCAEEEVSRGCRVTEGDGGEISNESPCDGGEGDFGGCRTRDRGSRVEVAPRLVSSHFTVYVGFVFGPWKLTIVAPHHVPWRPSLASTFRPGA